MFAAAAATGALARTAAARYGSQHDGMPYGILAVNVIGSFLVGLLEHVTPPVLTVLGVGGLGTFTTYSSFAQGVVALAERRRFVLSVAYALTSCLAGVGAAALGMALAP